MKHKQWTLLLGRFQCLPPHAGHIALIKTLLKEGKNVAIGLREADYTEKNPYSTSERYNAFRKIFADEIIEGKIRILGLPDINEIAYGRTPGWNIKEIKLSEDLEKISATERRKNADKESKS